MYVYVILNKTRTFFDTITKLIQKKLDRLFETLRPFEIEQNAKKLIIRKKKKEEEKEKGKRRNAEERYT